MIELSLLATVLFLISSRFMPTKSNFLLLLHCRSISTIDITKSESCLTSESQRMFDILPGTGWDNLENIPKGRVLHLNYDKCRHSNDKKYLIPNHISLTPIRESKVSLQSEIIDHFSNLKSITSRSINAEASGPFYLPIGGSYSYESSRAKEDQIKTKSSFSIVQLRYNIYSARFHPDPELDPTFKSRLLNIASLLISDTDFIYPQFLADMIVRDYGTHVIRSLDAGAILAKTDVLNEEYAKQFKEDSSKMSGAASASFSILFNFKMGGGSDATKTNTTEYDRHTTQTYIDTYGGSVYGSNFSVSEWDTTVNDNLVAIDRQGDPLYYVVTPKVFPELDTKTTRRLAGVINDAIKRYYTINTKMGCLKITSPNFNPGANVDGKDCTSPSRMFTFGGIFQTCDGDFCDGGHIVNPLTGNYGCKDGNYAQMILEGVYKCDDTCTQSALTTTCVRSCSSYKTYWCAYPVDQSNAMGYIFGGYYTDSTINRLTNTRGCQEGFTSLKLGIQTTICVSTYNPVLDASNRRGVSGFGGFYSCKHGNPLATDRFPAESDRYWPKRCPVGYTPNVMSIEQGCYLTYCSESNKFYMGKNSPTLKPPFIKLDYSPNITDRYQFNVDENFLSVKQTGISLQSVEKWLATNKFILVSCASSVIMVMIISLLVCLIQRNSTKKKLKKATPNGNHPGEKRSNDFSNISTRIMINE